MDRLLGKTLPFADSTNSNAHIWRLITISSRAKDPPAGALLELGFNVELLDSGVTRDGLGPSTQGVHLHCGFWGSIFLNAEEREASPRSDNLSARACVRLFVTERSGDLIVFHVENK